MCSLEEIKVEDIDHLGLIAGIIDEIGIVEIINSQIGIDPREKVSAGLVVKAILLNGLGFVSRPLYLFPEFFVGKATEHLLGKGIEASYLNDDKIGSTMDKLYKQGVSQIFLLIALAAFKKYQIATEALHLDSSSFSVNGQYNRGEVSEKEVSNIFSNSNPIKITQGYSRDHRPDLKQFMVDLIVSIERDEVAIKSAINRTGRFILATNVVNAKQLNSDEILAKYKQQQAAERGFAFLKDPLFFADSIFLKSPQRVETMAMLMGLCLLVYSLGQRQLRGCLKSGKTGIKNQLGKLTERPTLRWIFQCFQSIHLLTDKGVKHVSNLTEERRFILSFFPSSSQQYYLLPPPR